MKTFYLLLFTLILSFSNIQSQDVMSPEAKVWLKNMKTSKYFESNLTKHYRISSKDKKVNVYSYDTHEGGSWRDLKTYAQYKTSENDIRVKFLTKNCAEYSCYTDVINYEIYDIDINGKTFYLLFGEGTHGGGLHHKIIQVFSIEGDYFIRSNDILDNRSSIIIETIRGQEIEFKYNSNKKEIIYDEFIGETDYQKPNKIVKRVLKLKNGIFSKI